MPAYLVEYQRPGGKPEIWELMAASEPAARIRFLNLSWVVFTDIKILDAYPKAGGKPKAPPSASALPKPKTAKQIAADATKARANKNAELDRLEAEIGTLADEAQRKVRAGDQDGARELRAKARQLSERRAKIIRSMKE